VASFDSDIEFALKVTNADWEVKEVIDRLLELYESKDLKEAAGYAEEAFAALRVATVKRYTDIVCAMAGNSIMDTRDERIKMQGGM